MSKNSVIALSIMGAIVTTGLASSASAAEAQPTNNISSFTFDEKGNALINGQTFDQIGGENASGYYELASIEVNIFQCNCKVNNGCDSEDTKKPALV